MNVNRGHIIEQVNSAYEEIVGLSAEHICRQPSWDILAEQAGEVTESSGTSASSAGKVLKPSEHSIARESRYTK